MPASADQTKPRLGLTVPGMEGLDGDAAMPGPRTEVAGSLTEQAAMNAALAATAQA
ncbi:MAG TPA: hypothetical protein VM053_01600 [Gemmatimonadaceae bacterium]|nr:hypothetical protein [Gemmatimonadaceae bacterium]